MADYGVRLINKYDITVANDTDVNFTLRSSGQIHNSDFVATAGEYNQFAILGTAGFNCPIVFIKTSVPEQRVSVTPSTWETQGTFSNTGFRVHKWHNKNVGTLQYYIYDIWTPPERSDYGMQIFDERGKEGGGIIFDSGWHFMRLRAVKWLDPGYPNHVDDPAGFNYQTVMVLPANSNIALAMPVPRSYILNSGTTFGAFLYECFHYNASAGAVNISLVPYGEFLDMAPGPGWASDNSRSQVMVIDTTGVPTNYNSIT